MIVRNTTEKNKNMCENCNSKTYQGELKGEQILGNQVIEDAKILNVPIRVQDPCFFSTEFANCVKWEQAIIEASQGKTIMSYRAKCPRCSIEQDFIGEVNWILCRICNPAE